MCFFNALGLTKESSPPLPLELGLNSSQLVPFASGWIAQAGAEEQNKEQALLPALCTLFAELMLHELLGI